jgi:hypothetical protein
MKKIVITFGIIAGLIVSIMMFITMRESAMDMKYGELIGYATMIIAFSTIFFAIRAHRDKNLGGTIKFGKAFMIGFYITLIASSMYVISWMIISNTYGERYMDQYHEQSIKELKNSDKSPEEISAQIKSMEEFQELYNNPIFRIVITYLEILPAGLLVSLLCAGVLRKSQVKT